MSDVRPTYFAVTLGDAGAAMPDHCTLCNGKKELSEAVVNYLDENCYGEVEGEREVKVYGLTEENYRRDLNTHLFYKLSIFQK